MSIRDNIVRQFKRPQGFLGRLAGWSMAMRPSNRKRNRWTLKLLEIRPEDRVFELGCGPGFALSLAAKKAKKGFVAGVDHSSVMVEMARKRLAGPIRRGRAWVDVDGVEALAAAKNWDAIYSANVIQFFDDKERYVALAYAALNPGGRMATTYQPRGANPSSEQALAMAKTVSGLMREAGFKNVRVETLPLEPVNAVCVVGEKP